MKKIIVGVLLLFVVLVLINGTELAGTPVIAYVYSNSMEPLLLTHDAFIVFPTKKPEIGDIIMYRPVVLQASFVTHRIVGIGDSGYITKGDNSAFRDQENGEPQVSTERIVGKVLTISDRPVVIRGLGKITSVLRAFLGDHTKTLAAVFLIAGVVASLPVRHRTMHTPKPRRRIRLEQIYRYAILFGTGIVILSMILGSRVTVVKYLVSEYPGTTGNQIMLNEPGIIRLEVHNNGLFPVRTIVTGVPPLTVREAPDYLMPLSSKSALAEVSAQHETGIRQGYVRQYSYPLLLPGTWIASLHRISPVLALASVASAMGLWLSLIFMFVFPFHGFYGRIPLKAIRDKVLERRMDRAATKLFGRRRVR